ncbi:PTS beta-glucoside transporter subunit IIBCA [Niallia circulans]|uniref:PTS beta-glucoside transporter subunit IIBCA n=1 Tax=Niallia circulans TaxID=1397 RepID=A0A553SRF0_NIACI|nr:beta-glucoside-specific PTS transporter subunit IIABC [Niallia circulans]TRZ39574.1 PTS beta-glucoside transporter subunit IIBCA [Niallia circulans]
MKYKELNEQIIQYVGGKQNVEAVVHCMTRLRFTLKDRSLVKTEEIKELDKVIDVVSNNISYQIVIGTEVAEIYPELVSMLGVENDTKLDKPRQNIVKRILDLLSETITPILPAMMAVGLISAVLSIFTVSGLLSTESSTFLIFDSIRTSLFYFLSVFIAVSAAKRLDAPLYLAILLAATVLSPSINGVEGLSLFGIPLPKIEYANTFIPILIGVWFMGLVGKTTKKYIPKSLEYFFSPLIIMLITVPVTLFLFGPIGSLINDGISILVQFLMDTIGSWIVVALYAAGLPFLIMLGAGNFAIPLSVSFFSSLGYDPVFVHAYIIADIAVCGAMLGYMLKAKDKKQKQFFGTVSFSALMGVTEPAVFGAFVKYRRPFIAVLIGAGIGGLFAGLMNVKAYTFTTLFGVMSFIGESDYSNFYYLVIAIVISFVGSSIAGYLLWIPRSILVDNVEKTENQPKKIEKVVNKAVMVSPIHGNRVSLENVKDNAFSTGALGKGMGINPLESIVKSPIEGEIVTIFPTKHAIGLRSTEGIEVLIHVGIDTVSLNGLGFESLIEPGKYVKMGDPLLKVDFELIKEKGFDPTVIIVITNSQDYLEIIPNLDEEQDIDKGFITVIL